MIITLKTLQQVTLKIDIDSSKTVKDLKQHIEETHGKDYTTAHQKLIYSGKILADDTALSEYNIDEKKFVVLMIIRPPPPPKPATETKESTASKDSAATVKKESQSKESDKTPTAAGSSSGLSTGTPSLSVAESILVTGDEYKAMVKQMCDMGYTKKEVERALRASYNNPDRAVEYLVSGFPSDIEARMREPAQVAGTREVAEAPVTAPSEDSRSPLSHMADVPPQELWGLIRNQPQFRNMQQIVQQNPHLLSQAIESLAETNPDLYSLVSDHPDAFVNALQQPIGRNPSSQTPLQSQQQPQQQQRAAGQPGAEGEGFPLQDLLGGATQQDKDAIERLKQLGFPEHLVVQVYIACNKDEQLAANLLLEQMD